MNRTVIFAFQGNPICFVHVLLNALDISSRGGAVRIVLEGEACGLIPKLRKQDHPLHALYNKVKSQGFIDGVCKACAIKMESLTAVNEEELPVLDEMSGHAGMARYIEDGWTLITM